jgi:hypothetical protein
MHLRKSDHKKHRISAPSLRDSGTTKRYTRSGILSSYEKRKLKRAIEAVNSPKVIDTSRRDLTPRAQKGEAFAQRKVTEIKVQHESDIS